MRFTERSLRTLKHAEAEAEKTSHVVYPVHLLLGMLLERTGAFGELYINYPNLWATLNKRIPELHFDGKDQEIIHEFFNISVSPTMERVLEYANQRREHFKQTHINEGHLIEAVLKTDDPFTKQVTDGLDINRILETVCYPRDMIVPLKNYTFPALPESKITFRKAEPRDAAALKNYVEKEFGTRWLDSIENGFSQADVPVFLALEGEDMVGFACFDVVRMKKGLFGPMGTSFSNRTQGIGYTLLHYALKEMKKTGYEYAVIGEAGPIEFYEKACKAVVISKSFT